MAAEPRPAPANGALAIDYVPLADARVLPPDAIAAFTFGVAPPDDDPRWIRVGLRSLDAMPVAEVWRVDAATPPAAAQSVRTWRESLTVDPARPPCAVRIAALGPFSVGCIEIDEAAFGGIEHAGAGAYAAFAALAGTPVAPHILRMWNYLDAINEGDGDDERYRHFCAGRGAGLAAFTAPQLPAATGIGRCDGERTLQVYWLACERPGVAVENPRQLSAWRYPRQYGPVAPKFSRAMRADRHVFVSGTASVVGHETRHADCFDSQVRETVENLAAVLDAAGVRDARDRKLLLKAYVRDPGDAPRLRDLLGRALPHSTCLLLAADVCRRDLLVEIDCVATLD